MRRLHSHFKKEWKWDNEEKEIPSVVMTEEDLIKLAQKKGTDLQMNNRLTRSISRNFSLK